MSNIKNNRVTLNSLSGIDVVDVRTLSIGKIVSLQTVEESEIRKIL